MNANDALNAEEPLREKGALQGAQPPSEKDAVQSNQPLREQDAVPAKQPLRQKDALHGLSCPRCGGPLDLPEGQAIVICPYCDLRSIVAGEPGERGVRRYQVSNRVAREAAVQAYQKFLSGNMAIARGVARQAELKETLLVYLPFWAGWGRGLGWTFGRKEVGSGDHRHYEPREVKVIRELDWNAAACDVGEFGVNQISLAGRALEAFNADGLHRSGMVFEPVGSASEAMERARTVFESRIQREGSLDQVSQSFVRILRPRFGLVYYPLWVIRYQFRGRAFQVVVDGYSGEVLYGKAPGNALYRAMVLVGGMAGGSFIGISLPSLIISADSHGKGSGEFSLAAFVVGMVIMYASYRRFRYGEHYEYRRLKNPDAENSLSFDFLPSASSAIKMLSQIQRLR